MDDLKGKIAISCTSGGYKNVFTQGVLKAFEERNIRADAYAACSSSALIAAFAAFEKVGTLDLTFWKEGFEISQKEGNTQSQAMLYSIGQTASEIKKNLWSRFSSRLLIATSFVKSVEASSMTQTEQAKRLGQKLVMDSLRRRPEWKDQHLELRVFDTRPVANTKPLTDRNFEEVAYATTRVLHAWDVPAFIEGEPYIDGCYTCISPVLPLAGLGYEKIICITNEHDKTYLDLFSSMAIPDKVGNSVVDFIKPEENLKDLGVDYFSFTGDGLDRAYRQGYKRGMEFEF